MLKGIDTNRLADVLAGSRERNAYAPKMDELLSSDVPAVDVAESWPEFSGKKPTALYQGFRNAIQANDESREKYGDIAVKQNDGRVLLLVTSRVRTVLENAAQPEAETDTTNKKR